MFLSPPAQKLREPTNGLRQMLVKIFERHRLHRLLPARRVGGQSKVSDIEGLCTQLLSRRGDASGMVLAGEILSQYRLLTEKARKAFFESLLKDFGPDEQRLTSACAAYQKNPTPDSLLELSRSVEPPRQELFRRLNQARYGTSELVKLRTDLLNLKCPHFVAIDNDLAHLFVSWFNRGFLMLERVTWSSPADLLERIIRYEAVHMIKGWDDLRRRLEPTDRRCYGFFHPSLVDEPLIFVEVALTRTIPSSIDKILAEQREQLDPCDATAAVFYSISNCQDGLRGISFGNLLIKQVVEELRRDLPQLKTFVTLSPAPGFRKWLTGDGPTKIDLTPEEREGMRDLREVNWLGSQDRIDALRPTVEKLAAHYYMRAKGAGGQPLDPVARFHLGNGARLERLNWPADTSRNGLDSGGGLMVNYLYDPATIEKNHESFWNGGTVVVSSPIAGLLRSARQSMQGSR